ncbi:MAG TPA: carboxypeptidase-like regulatory domain-containing protein, partial [Bacteroidetes bacterium]|nr:carboxypeptidase-like regulatory domain-containing protein [Bacteroidota bacterium]
MFFNISLFQSGFHWHNAIFNVLIKNFRVNKKKLLVICFLSLSSVLFSQNTFNAIVEDKDSKEVMVGATIVLKGTTKGTTADADGKATITDIPDGKQTVIVSFTGYETIELKLLFPLVQTEPQRIYIMVSEEQMDEIVIEATRANRSVANLPTRTEVLTEEIDEAASMEPSRIAHLITHSTGIQVQTTSASSGGAVVRIQGLN